MEVRHGWRKLGYWIPQILGTFVCIAAFVNIGGALLGVSMFGTSFATSYYLMFTLILGVGFLLICAGAFFKPKPSSGIR